MNLLLLSARFLISVPLLIAGIYLLVKKEFKTLVLASASVLFVNILSEITKALIPENRPFVGNSGNPGIWLPFGNGSFFSGHTGTLFALGALFWFKNKTISLMCFIFGIIVGVLRVIIKVHYPVDIVGGAVIGVLVGFLGVRFLKKFKCS